MEGERAMSAQPRWDHTEARPRPVEVPARGVKTEQDRKAARIVTLIALASLAAAATIEGLNAQTLAFFWTVGVAQVVWGFVAFVAAPRWWLALGALGNAVVVATWLVSRSIGLPFGQFAHTV